MFIKKRERSDNFYQELQEKTLDRLQELSGKLWTDFNIHDPGVTISDNMNYALFELQYKLELPFHAFIGPDISEYENKGILPAEHITEPSIVTPEDYEQLFLEELADYLESCRVQFKNGFYSVMASVSVQNQLISKNGSTEHIKEAIFALYHQNRNLCEDLRWDDIRIFTKSVAKRKKKQDEIAPVEKIRDEDYLSKSIKIHNYHSFQLDFPDVYGIGTRGHPQEASPRNHAHVLQLKGYLLMMDFLMANVTEQIQSTPDLISFEETPPAGTVSWISIPEDEKVVDKVKFKKYNQLQSPASIQSKKTGFIDILDTLYGEDTAQLFEDFHPSTSKIAHRSTLTKELPELNRNRFRSFDKTKPQDSNVVFKELFSLLHGKKIVSEIPIRELLKKHNLDLLPDSVFFEQYEVYLDIAPISGVFYKPIFNETPENIPVKELDWDEKYFSSLEKEINLIKRNALFESFLEVGSNPRNYRMIRLSENGRWILIFRYPGKEDWMILGDYRTKVDLINSSNLLWSFVRFLNPERHLFYLVEHRLLQFAYPTEQDEEEGYTLSIIASSQFEKEEMPQQLEHLIRERLPAHLKIRLYQVDRDYIYDFEQIYYKWRDALAGNNQKLVHFSESIKAFFRISKPFMKEIQ